MKVATNRPVGFQPTRLNRLRYQLGGGLLLAVVIPYVARSLAMRGGTGVLDALYYHTDAAADATLVATFGAVLLGYYLLRSLSNFPGVKNAYFVMPSYSLSYVMVAAVLFFARIDYSRGLLIASYVICVFWFVSLYSIFGVRQRIRLGVVPFGSVATLPAIAGVSWRPLRLVDDTRQDVDAVVADFRADLPDEWERLLADLALEGMVVYHIKQLNESLTGRVDIEHLSENSFGSMVPLVAYLRLKMALDWVFALLLAVPVALLLLFVGLIVRLESPGAAIFRQTRIGYRGEPFTVYKIRTMREPGSSPVDALQHAITTEGDSRVTRLGRLLRRSRVDELPQILNVLKGEMSWIGPRPEAVALSQWYERELPYYRYRHVVRPGISGWAQVNQGHVALINDVREKLQNDFYYIKYFSPWLDGIIVIRTISTMLTGFGSR